VPIIAAWAAGKKQVIERNMNRRLLMVARFTFFTVNPFFDWLWSVYVIAGLFSQ
jgi:hypothetical protein